MKVVQLFVVYLIVIISVFIILSIGPQTIQGCLSCQISIPVRILLSAIVGSLVIFILMVSTTIVPETPEEKNLYILLMFLMYFGPIIGLIILAGHCLIRQI